MIILASTVVVEAYLSNCTIALKYNERIYQITGSFLPHPFLSLRDRQPQSKVTPRLSIWPPINASKEFSIRADLVIASDTLPRMAGSRAVDFSCSFLIDYLVQILATLDGACLAVKRLDNKGLFA